MKKLLTLLMLVCMACTGAWAQGTASTFEIAISPNEGSFYRGTSSWNDTSKPWCSRFLSNDIEISEGVSTKVDISVTSPSYQNNYNHKDNNGFYVCPGASGCTYTIRLSNTDYVVKSVTMTLNEAGGANATNIVIAGQTYARTNATTTPLTLTKVPATAFKVSGNNSFVKITDIRLEVAPFEVASDIANAKWFQLNVRGKYVVYDAASNTYHDTTTDQPSVASSASWFAFVGSSKDDFKIVNYAAGLDKAMGADNVTTETRLSAKDYASAQSYKIEEVTYQGTKGIQIREKNNNNAFLNQQPTNLGYWNADARGDYGNLFVINAVDNAFLGEMPEAGKVYTIYNDHVGVPYYVSNSRNTNANAQDITATRATDGSQEWIFWGDATNNYKFYNLADNSIILKSYNGQETHKVINERKRIGYTIVQPTNSSKRIGGDTYNPSLNGGIFSSGTYNEYVNGNLHWSTDFVFVPTGENAYKVVVVNGASNTSVTYGGKTVSNNGFLTVDENVTVDAICAEITTNNAPTGFSPSVSAEGNVITVECIPVGDETIIYNPNKNKYVNAGLTLVEGVENAATYIKVNCGENATYPTTNGQEYPKFKLYVSGKGWVSKAADDTDMTTKGGTKFGFSTDGTKALEFIYVGNDIIPVVCFGYTDGEHGQLSWNWYANTGVLGLYGVDDNGCNWTFNTQYTINSTGLQSSEVGGVCYNRVNYAGTKAQLPYTIDESALIAMHVSGYNGTVEVNDATKTITVTYSTEATAGPTLWPDNNNSSNLPAARIPAIVKSQDYILAFSDWRYNRNDIGRGDNGKRIDIEMRRSHDNGQTWEPAIIVAQGTGVSGYEAAHGDAAVVADRESGKVLMLAASGNATDFSGSSRSNPIKIGKFTSSDNGANWEKSEVTSSIYGLFPETVTKIFVSSGKILQGSVKKAGAANYRIYAVLCTNEGNHVIYSDNFGETWGRLGNACTAGNEAHVTELPNGDLLLDSRAGGARYVNVYTYANKQDGMAVLGDSDEQGAWGTYGTMGIPTSSDGCNGDIDILTAYPAGSSEAVKVVLQTSPRSGRNNVSYYYMRLPEAVDGQYNVNDFVGAAKWTSGYEVFHGASAYTSIFHDEQGDVHMFFEKNTTGSTWSYNMTYEKHNISQITNNAYFGEDPSVEQTIVAILSDGNGNTFEHEYQGTVGTLPTVPAYCTVATDGSWAKVDDHFTYTAGITMPFVVSNNESQKYYNIYYPIASGGSPCYLYYNSNNASQLRNDHSVTNKGVDDAQVMTASQNNTYKYSWAIYGDPFTGFTFKNRQSNTFINIAGASASGTQNAALAAEGSLFTLDYATNGTYNGRWTMQSGTGYIVLWSWTNDVATYNTNANHQGGHFYLVEAPDFEAMTTTLGEKCDGLGTTLGTYAYTGSAEDLSTAKSIVAGETTPTNAKQLKTLITALTNGRGTLNMPQPGSFLRLKSHKFGTYLNSATVAWNGNSNLLTLVNGKTGDNEKTTIMYLTEDRHLVTYATGMGLCNSIQIKTAASDPYEGNTVLTFSEDSKNNTGCYNIKGTYGATNNYLYGYSDKLARNGSVTDECVWELEEVETLPLTVGSTTFATFYTPVNVAVPSGITPYVCNLSGDNLAMYTCKQKTTIGGTEYTVIPAHTAVMIKSNNAQTYSLSIVEDESIEEYDNNSFFGDVATKPFATDFTYYSLQRDQSAGDGTVGFFVKPEGNFKGFQAFLKTEKTQAVQRFNVTFDEDAVITGIANVLGTENITIPAFDLSGRKVDANTHRGLYIMNGKKVIR